MYSLRHTYISLRLMEGANIYQIANNCRTSVGMIEKLSGAYQNLARRRCHQYSPLEKNGSEQESVNHAVFMRVSGSSSFGLY